MSAWFVAPDFKKSPASALAISGVASWVNAKSAAIHRHDFTDGPLVLVCAMVNDQSPSVPKYFSKYSEPNVA